MYSFAQRPDTKVMDEPFYGFYLQATGLEHPGRAQILATTEPDPQRVFAQIAALAQKHEHVFVKNMGHHLSGFDYRPIRGYANIFLIRDPGQMLYSYAQVRQHLTLNDIGIKQQAELFAWLQAAGESPVVLDGNELRQNPRGVLRQLCAMLNIPFREEMLSWPAGPRPEDGIWAPHWYAQVHQSTGFRPPDSACPALPAALQATYAAALPFYTFLKNHALLA